MSRTVTPFAALVLAVVGSAALALGAASAHAPRPGARPVAGARKPATPPWCGVAQPPPDRRATAPAAPVRLTASDGTGLSLVAIEANGVLEPPLALTELRLTFETPRDEIIE